MYQPATLIELCKDTLYKKWDNDPEKAKKDLQKFPLDIIRKFDKYYAYSIASFEGTLLGISPDHSTYIIQTPENRINFYKNKNLEKSSSLLINPDKFFNGTFSPNENISMVWGYDENFIHSTVKDSLQSTHLGIAHIGKLYFLNEKRFIIHEGFKAYEASIDQAITQAIQNFAYHYIDVEKWDENNLMCSEYHAIKIFNIDSKKINKSIPVQQDRLARQSSITSHRQELIAARLSKKSGKIGIWNINDPNKVIQLDVPNKEQARVLAFSPCGNYLAYATQHPGNKIYLCNVQKKEIIGHYDYNMTNYYTKYVPFISWKPNGKSFVINGDVDQGMKIKLFRFKDLFKKKKKKKNAQQ